MATTEILTDPHHVRGDLRKIEQGIRQGWSIPDAVFQKAAIIIAGILQNGTNREKIAAARALVAMNEQNNPDPVIIAHQHQHLHQHVQPVTALQETDIERKRRELSGRIARLR